MRLLFLLTCLLFAPMIAKADSSTSWGNVAAAIDSYAEISDCIFLAGNNATGPAFVHVKGATLTSTSTHIAVASATKMIAGSIIYRLIETGILGLDDLVSAHLSYWTKSTSDPRHAITVRQLLAFTGGFKDDDICCGSSGYSLQSCAQQI